MIKVVQASDWAFVMDLLSDGGAALEKKRQTARCLFTDGKSWIKPREPIAILHELVAAAESRRKELGALTTREAVPA